MIKVNSLYIVRSSYHFQLITQNIIDSEKIHIILVDNSFEIPNTGNDFCILKDFDVNPISPNRNKFKSMTDKIDKYNFNKVVVFNNYFPYSRFFIDYALEKNIGIEMWEDGLNHYLNEHINYLFYIKSAIKLLLGHYRSGIFSPNYKYNDLVIKDRFLNKNLRYEIKNLCHMKETKIDKGVVFVAQPLVEDRYLRLNNYIKGLERVKSKYKAEKLYYLPHPRESLTKRKINRIESIGFEFLYINESAEEFLITNKFKLCVSPFSTTLINICSLVPCEFVPAFFNLRRIEKKLQESLGIDLRKYL